MPGLNKSDLHEITLEALNGYIETISEIDEPPLEVRFRSDRPAECRFYLFTLSEARDEHRAEDEYRIALRFPEHNDGDINQAAPDRSGEHLVIISGYDTERELFVIWDDDLYDSYAWTSHLQVKEDTLNRAQENGIETQHRQGGAGGETVIVSSPDKLREALRLRYCLQWVRTNFDKMLTANWREINSKNESEIVQKIEIHAAALLTFTAPTRPVIERARWVEMRGFDINIDSLSKIGLESKADLHDVIDTLDRSWMDKPSRKEVEGEFEAIERKLSSEPSLIMEEESYEETRRKARSEAFKKAVREAYDGSCAVCGNNRVSPDGIPEVEAAHIYPKGLNGSDDVRNGLALCRLHHWAFDTGWISISDDYLVLVREEPSLEGYEDFSPLEGVSIHLPDDENKHPALLFLSHHRKLHGFE
jgi:hypothetical protein